MTYTDQEKRVFVAWLNMSETESGRIIFDDLEKTYRLQVSHVEGDPYTTAFRDGQRDGAYNTPLRMIEEAREMLKAEGQKKEEE